MTPDGSQLLSSDGELQIYSARGARLRAFEETGEVAPEDGEDLTLRHRVG